jgi:hypothetical protein
MLRTTADISWAVATLGTRWKYLSSDRDRAVRKRIEHGIFLNFTINSWLKAAGLRYRDINPRLTSIMKNYFTYITAVDEFIDQPGNRGDRLMRFSADDEIKEMEKRFLESLLMLDKEKQEKARALFAADVETMTSAIMKYQKINGLADAEELRLGTSGTVVKSHIRLLNIIYSVPEERAKVIEDAYMNLGMVAQVQDDLLDLEDDMKRGIDENLIRCLFLRNPDELGRVRELLDSGTKMNYRRLVRRAPATAKAARELQEKYVRRITDSDALRRLDPALYLRELERDLIYIIGI